MVTGDTFNPAEVYTAENTGQPDSKAFGPAVMGIMENEMETTLVYWGFRGDNGKENGNYFSILGF